MVVGGVFLAIVLSPVHSMRVTSKIPGVRCLWSFAQMVGVVAYREISRDRVVCSLSAVSTNAYDDCAPLLDDVPP